MTSRAATEYRYEKLTWPEIDDAIEMGKVCVVPCGSVEQHGPHLPLDVDIVCPQGIAYGAGRAVPDKMLVLPPVWYGYTGHVMDFPGTINTHYETFIHQVLDITKSLAYHGFKKIVLLNGHGSNMPNLDLVGSANESGNRRRVHPGRVVEPADGGQDVSAALAPEQVPRRLRSCLRIGNLAVSVSRRRQCAQGQDRERHHQLQ